MTTNQIATGSILTARSACDHECVFSITVISRTEKSAVVEYNGKIRRTKIHVGYDGAEFIRPENYSMAPIFRAA
jgi:hypothetical protein